MTLLTIGRKETEKNRKEENGKERKKNVSWIRCWRHFVEVTAFIWFSQKILSSLSPLKITWNESTTASFLYSFHGLLHIESSSNLINQLNFILVSFLPLILSSLQTLVLSSTYCLSRSRSLFLHSYFLMSTHSVYEGSKCHYLIWIILLAVNLEESLTRFHFECKCNLNFDVFNLRLRRH